MILFVHIIFALANICFSVFTVIVPSLNKLRILYLLSAGTMISGVILIFVRQTPLIQVCLSGTIYLVLITLAIFLARRKLAFKPL